jgi:hypothetical protein
MISLCTQKYTMFLTGAMAFFSDWQATLVTSPDAFFDRSHRYQQL